MFLKINYNTCNLFCPLNNIIKLSKVKNYLFIVQNDALEYFIEEKSCSHHCLKIMKLKISVLPLLFGKFSLGFYSWFLKVHALGSAVILN